MYNNKICILGDSVALRVRPPRNEDSGRTYAEHLRILFPNYIIDNRATGALPINKQINNRDIIIRELPGVYIINFGIVDCSTRPIPHWLFHYINSFDEAEGKAHKLFRKFISYFENKYRRQLVKIRSFKSWTSPQKFTLLYRGLIQQLQKETSARIICIGINKTNERIYSQLPRTNERIAEYNNIIKNCCEAFNCVYIDPSDHIDMADTPDGIHYNASGHLRIANALERIIKNYNNE